MSGYTAEQLQAKISKELETIHCEITDLSDGCGGKFGAVIVSAKFEGKPLLARHRYSFLTSIIFVVQNVMKNHKINKSS